jgi:hypothetical protein
MFGFVQPEALATFQAAWKIWPAYPGHRPPDRTERSQASLDLAENFGLRSQVEMGSTHDNGITWISPSQIAQWSSDTMRPTVQH